MGRSTNRVPTTASSLDRYKLWFEDLPDKQKPNKHKTPKNKIQQYDDDPLELKHLLDNNSRSKRLNILRPTIEWRKGYNLAILYVKRWLLTLKKAAQPILGLTFRLYSFIMNTVIKLSIERTIRICNELQYNIKQAIIRLQSTSSRKDGMKMLGKNKDKSPQKDSANSEKPVEKKAKNSKPWYKHSFVFGILGIYMATVFVSIAWACIIIAQGLDGTTKYIMLAPAATFSVLLAIGAFWKLFK